MLIFDNANYCIIMHFRIYVSTHYNIKYTSTKIVSLASILKKWYLILDTLYFYILDGTVNKSVRAEIFGNTSVVLLYYSSIKLFLCIISCRKCIPCLTAKTSYILRRITFSCKHVPAIIRHVLPLSLIHIWRCRRYAVCRSRWSPYH